MPGEQTSRDSLPPGPDSGSAPVAISGRAGGARRIRRHLLLVAKVAVFFVLLVLTIYATAYMGEKSLPQDRLYGWGCGRVLALLEQPGKRSFSEAYPGSVLEDEPRDRLAPYVVWGYVKYALLFGVLAGVLAVAAGEFLERRRYPACQNGRGGAAEARAQAVAEPSPLSLVAVCTSLVGLTGNHALGFLGALLGEAAAAPQAGGRLRWNRRLSLVARLIGALAVIFWSLSATFEGQRLRQRGPEPRVRPAENDSVLESDPGEWLKALDQLVPR